MKVFLIAGPGHHFHNVKLSLAKLSSIYSYSNYWPVLSISLFGKKVLTNAFFNSCSKAIYFLHNRLFKYFFKYNVQDEYVLRLYSEIVSRHIQPGEYDVIWGFQMVSLNTFEKLQPFSTIKVLDYAMIHIDEYLLIMEKEYTAQSYKGFKNSSVSNQFRKLIKGEYDLADHIIVLSSYARQTMIDRGVAEDKITQIPLSVDTDFYIPAKKKEIMADKPLNFLFVGRIEYLKGVHYLLEAFVKLESSHTLTLAGDVSAESEVILRPYCGLKNISIVGSKEKKQLLEIYQAHDVLILPSIQESFGLVILEAMSCGLAVIASKNSGAPDIIEHGVDGLLVNPFDYMDILDKLTACVNDRKELNRLRSNARKKIEFQFSPEEYNKKVEAFLKQLKKYA